MIEVTPQHAKAIKDRYREACKLNDVDAAVEFGKIRRRACELGYAQQQVTRLLREARDD